MSPSQATRAGIDAAEAAASKHLKQVQPCESVYALGDCCADIESPLPALAQVSPSAPAHVLRCCCAAKTTRCLECCSRRICIHLCRITSIIREQTSAAQRTCAWLTVRTRDVVHVKGCAVV